jgi:hypothetical protein
MTEKPPITIKTNYIYSLTPTTVTIGISQGSHTITRVHLKILKSVYQTLLNAMQDPLFFLKLPVTLYISSHIESANCVYDIKFAKSEREPKNDKDLPQRNT